MDELFLVMTKRCKNCGWPNDDSCVKCQKCNAPLDGDSVISSNQGTVHEPVGGYQPTTGSGDNLRKTVSENQFFGTGIEDTHGSELANSQDTQNESECPNCHYQVRPGVGICPNCGTPINKKRSGEEERKKCVNCGEMNPAQAIYCNRCGKPLDVDANAKPMNNVTGGRMGTVNPWMQPNSGTFCTLRPIAWEGENVQYQPLSFSGSSIILNRANTDPNNQSITSHVQAELSFEDGEWYIIDKSVMHTTYVMASRKMKLKKGDTIILGNRLFEFN